MEDKRCHKKNCEECGLNDLYAETFKGGEYREQFYKKCDIEFRFWMINIHEMFSKVLPRKEKCHQLLEFACGPVPIYAATALADKFPACVTFADVVEDNRKCIEKWMKGQEEKDLSWEPQFKFIEKLSGRRLLDIEKTLRSSFKETLYCDAHQEMPIAGKKNFFDIIMTNLSLEYACVDMEKYKNAVRNVGNMLKPGGYFCQGGALNISSYDNLGKSFPAVSLTFDRLKEVFDDPETDMQMTFYNFCAVPDRPGTQGMEGIFYIVAQKMGPHVQKKKLVTQVWKDSDE